MSKEKSLPWSRYSILICLSGAKMGTIVLQTANHIMQEETQMSERRLSEKCISAFREYLILEEKSGATIEKYLRDIGAFSVFTGGQTVTKDW